VLTLCHVTFTPMKLVPTADEVIARTDVGSVGCRPAILRDLPGSGPLFPYLRTVRANDRATEFKQRCHGLPSLSEYERQRKLFANGVGIEPVTQVVTAQGGHHATHAN
jgi:hypothetical protein